MDPRARLIRQLQLAHAGERAAAIAYIGHARSLRRGPERDAIKKIEADEWGHRRRLGEMLRELGAGPARLREAAMCVIGSFIFCICFVTGRFIPMYGAGKIERRNVHEYLDAARYAEEAGQHQYVDELLTMAEVEWDHEQFFRACVSGHFLLRMFPPWPALPPRASLRTDYRAAA